MTESQVKMKNWRYFWTFVGILAFIPLAMLAMFFAGGGHGSYIPMVILFPATSIGFKSPHPLNEYTFFIFGILQYPLYGLIIDFLKKFRPWNFIGVAFLHFLLVIYAWGYYSGF